jgi:hypothetical protein
VIINQIDVGGFNPFPKPMAGQEVGTQLVERASTLVWPRGAIGQRQTVQFWVKAWQSIGGNAAGSASALDLLCKQIEELANNAELQPCFIQWRATADPAAGFNQSSPADGWYVINSFEPDRESYLYGGLVKCQMTVTQVAPHPTRYAMGSFGGNRSTNYSGTLLTGGLLAAPIGSTNPLFGTRIGAEGSYPFTYNAGFNPYPLLLPASVANWWAGRVRIYDTINTTSNPVPTTGGYVHANWVEVQGADHDFVGDCVITNGLVLLLLQNGVANQLCLPYVWNTALGTPAWQSPGTLHTLDSGGNQYMTLRSLRLQRVGMEVADVICSVGSGLAYYEDVRIRIERGSYVTRLDITPKNFAATYVASLTPAWTSTIGFDSTHVADNALAAERSTTYVATDYGYGGLIPKANASYQLICAWLFQNQPASDVFMGGSDCYLYDNIASGATASYGFAMLPYSGAQNLQGEAESGTMANGWASAADSNASNGNAAKLANGTGGSTALLTWMASQQLGAGSWIAGVRLRTTTGTSPSATERFYVFDVTGNVGVTPFVSLAPNAVGSTYKWVQVSTPFAPTAGHSYQLRCDQGAGVNATDDWWVDEGVFLPTTLTADNRGLKELWQQFMFDRDVTWSRAA